VSATPLSRRKEDSVKEISRLKSGIEIEIESWKFVSTLPRSSQILEKKGGIYLIITIVITTSNPHPRRSP